MNTASVDVLDKGAVDQYLHGALAYLGKVSGECFRAEMWLDSVQGELALFLSVDAPDAPPIVAELPGLFVLFEHQAQVKGMQVYRATGWHQERSELPHQRYVALTASGLRLEGCTAHREGGTSHE